MANLIAKITNDKLLIDISINKTLVPSSTGKTLLVASSRGPKKTNAEVDGKQVYVNLSAYVYPS